jgi:hypothetical protein
MSGVGRREFITLLGGAVNCYLLPLIWFEFQERCSAFIRIDN